MSKQAVLGLFTLLGIAAIFAVFFILADFGTRSSGYKIGVLFKNASGLRPSATVSLSGVPIGAVDKIALLRDYSTEVVLAIKQGYEIPVGSRFLIQAPLTGEPTVLIDPPRNVAANVATYPHEIAEIANQPRGTNPTSLTDLLEEGQGEVRRLDQMLGQLQRAEPTLLADLKSTLDNTNTLTTNANRSIDQLTSKVGRLADSLQTNLTAASANVVQLTGSLNDVVHRDSGQVDGLLAQLSRTAHSFGETVDSLRDVATNPRVKKNLIDTTREFALTAKTFAELTGDLRKVTGNPQTQAQLRDTVAELDATSQKVNSLVGSLGGTSSVYGVDPHATPAPEASEPPPGTVPTSQPLFRPRNTQSSTGPDERSTTGGVTTAGTQNNRLSTLRSRLNSFTKDLVALQIRASVLAPQRPGSQGRNVSPLLTSDRGPQSDFNIFLLPRGRTGLIAGANDIGSSSTSTANLMLLNRSGSFSYGGGIEYSRLGIVTSVGRGAFGLETRAYDLRHPTLDAYLNARLAQKAQIFLGQRDLSHAQRRGVIGLQFEL